MDIEHLKHKRQLNVQEQNALEKGRILKSANYWRVNIIPSGLADVLRENNINLEKCILLNYHQDFPGCSTDFGIVLTDDCRFFEFDMDLSKSREKLIELYAWKEITKVIEINEHKLGTGKSWGYLAIEVMKEVNQC